MHITLARIDNDFLMEATNENGNTVRTDGSPDIGGSNQAMRPMQMLLSSLGACSSIDVIHLLRKMRQPLEDIKIDIKAEREQDKVPSLFTAIHVHYLLYGAIDPKKAERAVNLSMEKYCSVTKILEKTATVTSSFEIIEK